MGVTIDEILVGDPPEAWAAAGFTVDDDGSCRIGQVRVRLVGRDGGKRILGWSLRGAPAARLADGTLDGLPTTASDAPPVEPATHPNGSQLHRPRRAAHPRPGPHDRGAGDDRRRRRGASATATPTARRCGRCSSGSAR